MQQFETCKTLYLILILFIGISFRIHAQEICDNAIDDDDDGLVDLNDEDCICNTLLPSSLIPNPSFEDRTCCPTENARLDCAVAWIQASRATTDYVHTCGGYLGNTSIPAFAPLPFPDGEGGVGFRDGQAQAGSNYKEYVGACLTEPMEVGANYRFDFFVGFRDNVPGSKGFDIALFASNNCSNLPYGGTNARIGCPLNTNNYNQLGLKYVSGSNEWVNVKFDIFADQPYEVIVLGPACSGNPNYTLNPYFYVDRLTLAESSEFGIPFESISGSICENDLVLKAGPDGAYDYQWYLDGIAIPGETGSSLLLTSIDDAEGMYMAVLTGPDGCLFSQEYELKIPPYYAQDTVVICELDYYLFGNDSLTVSGAYERLIAATDGCDSIIQLWVDVLPNSFYELHDTICKGEIYNLYDISTSEAGIHEIILPNAVGCDSIISLTLSIANEDLSLELEADKKIVMGKKLDIVPAFAHPAIVDFIWTNDSGSILSTDIMLSDYRPLETTTLFLEGTDIYGCKTTDSMQIEVLAVYNLYIPNAFSPDGDAVNDYFTLYPSLAVEKVNVFQVYDRWGTLVFEDKTIDDIHDFEGWDGTKSGDPLNPGIYSYLIEVQFLDGMRKIIKGDIALLR